MDAITEAMSGFFWAHQNSLLPITLIFWFAFKITRRDKALFVASVLLVAVNHQYIYIVQMNPGMLGMWLSSSYRNNLFLPFFSLIIGIWGIIRTLYDLPTTLKGDSVVDSWNMIVEQGAGHDQWILDTTGAHIKEARMPNCAYHQEYVSTSLFGQKRKCLIVEHIMYRDYKMYISARNFGANLDVSWFFTITPTFLKRTLSKYTTGNPQALSQQIDFFDQQDLKAFVTVSHHCLKRAVDLLLEELKQEPIGLSAPQSKGFLSVW